MIRRLVLAVAAILAGMGMLAFESRAQSIHPCYEDDDVVVRHELLGKWKVVGIPVEFTATAGNAYVVKLGLDGESTVCFLGHLIRLDGRYFLDLQISGLKMASSTENSTTSGQDANERAKSSQRDSDSEIGSCSDKQGDDNWFLNREHMLFLLNFTSDPDSFDVEFWNDTWISEMAQQKKLTVPFTKSDDDEKQIVFFGGRNEMRDLVISLPAEAFGDSLHLERVSSDAANAASQSELLPEGMANAGRADRVWRSPWLCRRTRSSLLPSSRIT